MDLFDSKCLKSYGGNARFERSFENVGFELLELRQALTILVSFSLEITDSILIIEIGVGQVVKGDD
jgi:hypothetical protein